MSHTMVPMNIVNALVKAEDILGEGRVWGAQNPLQSQFLAQFFSERGALKCFTSDELRAWTDTVAENLNSILAKEGFNIRLDEFGEGEFGVVSVLDILVEWVKEGAQGTLRSLDGKSYPAACFGEPVRHLDGGKSVLVYEAFALDGASSDVALVRMHTKSGDTVSLIRADAEEEGFALIQKIDSLRGRSLREIYPDTLTFPMLRYDAQKTLDWLVGMGTSARDSRTYVISQALQQTKFKMNHLGARLKDAVALSMRCTSFRKRIHLIFDQPFYLWIERPGLPVPILYAYFDQEDWADPGDLATI